MPRHIEQPGSRQSKPASLKILSRPSASACSFTSPEPGYDIHLPASGTLEYIDKRAALPAPDSSIFTVTVTRN